MIVRSARVKHLVEVFEDLSDVTRNELLACGRLPFNLMGEMRQTLFRAGAVSRAVSTGGDTLFIISHEPHPTDEHARVMSSAYAQAYFDMGASGVRLGRRFLKAMQREWSGVTFISATRSPHPDTARWLTLLGFEPVTKDVYRLPPTNVDKTQRLR